MTFYELEKECKKRRIKTFGFIILIFFVIGLIAIYFYINFSVQRNKKYKKNIKKVEHKRNLNRKNLKKINKKNQQNHYISKLLPVINLDIKKIDLNTSKVNVKTNSIPKIIPKKPVNNQSIILQSKILPSFDTCINLSKKYLQERDYKDALKWAKFANIQDKKNPLSWIISAKILYKMGRKKEAVKLLKIYNSYYNNNEVKKLIRKLDEK